MEPYYHVYIMNVESNVCNLLSKIFRKQNWIGQIGIML
jgi:hypothetical protein